MIRREIVLSNPVRTAIGTFDGSLKTVPATELGATVVRAVLERSKLKGSDVDAAVMGNVIQAGNKMNPARQAAVDGGLPVDVPAMTINASAARARKPSCRPPKTSCSGWRTARWRAAWRTWIGRPT